MSANIAAVPAGSVMRRKSLGPANGSARVQMRRVSAKPAAYEANSHFRYQTLGRRLGFGELVLTCGLTVELSGAHAGAWAWHFILHASAPTKC